MARECRIDIRLSRAEMDDWVRQCAIERLSLSAWIRKTCNPPEVAEKPKPQRFCDNPRCNRFRVHVQGCAEYQHPKDGIIAGV